MAQVQTAAIRSQAALIVSPRASARTPKAAAPSAETRAQPRIDSGRTRRKLRRRLPMFKFEHRFELLEPLWSLSLVVERRGALSTRARGTGATPTPANARVLERARRHRHRRRDGARPLGRARIRAEWLRRRLQLPRNARTRSRSPGVAHGDRDQSLRRPVLLGAVRRPGDGARRAFRERSPPSPRRRALPRQ